jgi:hypothetical protein
MMSKQQRLYYEYSRKERVREELIELIKKDKEIEDMYGKYVSFNPHKTFLF